MICTSGLANQVNWQSYCVATFTMKNNNFNNITDAYQLISGARIKGKKQDEIFELGDYDANKRGYTVYPYEEGVKFKDFSVVISEKELKNNYLIEDAKATSPDAETVNPSVKLANRYLKSA
ncbi:MAG: hypothetical protein JWQ06_1475 [Mucilaginibacter sp.]|nr:hypothetical protein [Mucilaginibacter sp.]